VEKYEVLIKPSAVKELELIPKADRKRMANRISRLSGNPRPTGCEKLTAEEKYRIRQGQYRAVYSIDDSAKVVLVVKIAHRKDVYK
jgi:mRNA interferase RelE/StbE